MNKVQVAEIAPAFWNCCEAKPTKIVAFDDDREGVLIWHYACEGCASTVQASRVQDAPMGTYQGKTAEQWREESRAGYRRKEESFDRCDTDGFMSQWAHGINAAKYNLCAEVAEQDGWWEFPAVFDLSGRLRDAQLCEGQYGLYYWIKDARPGASKQERYFSRSHARSGARRLATDERKGFRVGTVKRRAYVTMAGANLTSVHPCVRPDRYDDRVIIIDDGTKGTQYQDEA